MPMKKTAKHLEKVSGLKCEECDVLAEKRSFQLNGVIYLPLTYRFLRGTLYSQRRIH